MPSKKMSLAEWIALKGEDEIARLLDVHKNTVRYWRVKHTHPTVPLMRKIKRLTRGQVDYDGIIDGRKGRA